VESLIIFEDENDSSVQEEYAKSVENNG